MSSDSHATSVAPPDIVELQVDAETGRVPVFPRRYTVHCAVKSMSGLQCIRHLVPLPQETREGQLHILRAT